MGVDADCVCIYGIYWEDSSIYESFSDTLGDKLFGLDDENSLCYNYDALEKLNAVVVNEPYSGDWTLIGIEFISPDCDELIANLQQAKKDWEVLKSAILEVCPEVTLPDPEVIHFGYFS